MSRAEFLVAGHPAPKGSRSFLGNGRSKESCDRVEAWVQQVAYAARSSCPTGGPLEPPYEIEMTLWMPEPENPKWAWPTRDGDGDKLERAVLDGMTQGGMLLDDRHVIACAWRKLFGVPRLMARVL